MKLDADITPVEATKMSNF